MDDSGAAESTAIVATTSSRARLAGWLLDTAGSEPVALMPLPQERLAWRLGTTRVTLNRAVHQIGREGIIDVNGANVAIVDRTALFQIAERT